MNKKLFLGILLLVFLFLLNPLFAQEIPYHESGKKSDLRIFFLEEQVQDFDVLHYKFEWRLDFDSKHLEGKAVVKIRSQSIINQITLHLADNKFLSLSPISMIFLIFIRFKA